MWKPWEKWLIVALVFLIGLLIGMSPTGNGSGQSGPEWTDVVMAIFTIVLAIVAIVGAEISREQKKLLAQSNSTALEALNASTESKRAYIEAESARIVLYSVKEKVLLHQVSELHFIIENVGQGFGVITGDWMDVIYLPKDTTIPKIDREQQLTPVVHFMKAGEKLHTKSHERQYHPVPSNTNQAPQEDYTVKRAALKLPARPDDAVNMVFRYLIRYETLQGTVRLAGGTWRAIIFQNHMERMFGPDYTFDVITDQAPLLMDTPPAQAAPPPAP